VIEKLPLCNVCRAAIGACHDVDLGPVCGPCKSILILQEFDLKQIAEPTGIEFCADAKIKHRTINERHTT
jgi:hypothetical protein